MTLTTWRIAAAALVGGLLTGCSGSSGNGAQPNGALSLALTDAPVDEVAEIWVEVTGIRIKPHGDGPPTSIPFEPPVRVDLLTLTPDNAETLLDGHPLPAGAYEWLALDVNAELDGVFDSYVVTLQGGQEELRVPSGSQTGLKLVSGFTITSDVHTRFLLDWDTRKGLVRPPGLPGFLLRPAIRILDMTRFGSLEGMVAIEHVTDPSCTNDLNLDTGNAVYIYKGFDVVPDDLDEADPEPVAIARVKQNPQGDYRYAAMLSPGEYTVAFTCQASADLPDTDEVIAFVGPQNVLVKDGETVTVDF